MFSQAGIFRDGAAAGNMGAEVIDEGSGGRREETVEISSETSGALRCSRSTEDDIEGEGEHDDDDVEEEEEDEQNGKKKKKRKKYHRHTAEQIREMEAYVFFLSFFYL